jgi:hypothetical protein
MLGSAGGHRHRVGVSLHAVLDRMGEVGQTTLTDIAVAHEVVDSDPEEVARGVGKQAR